MNELKEVDALEGKSGEEYEVDPTFSEGEEEEEEV